MTEKELIDNMRMGSRNPNAENDKNDLGRFGLGLKNRIIRTGQVFDGGFSKKWNRNSSPLGFR